MKSTGIVRKLDNLGKIIPIEVRRTLNIEEKDGLEIMWIMTVLSFVSL